MSKMGRPKQNIYDDANNLIVGLSFDTANQTYFAYYKDDTGKTKKYNCGRDKAEAISRFRTWQTTGGRKQSPTHLKYLERLGKKDYISLSAVVVEKLGRIGLDITTHTMGIMDGANVVIRTSDFSRLIVEQIENGKVEETILISAGKMIAEKPFFAAQIMKMPFLSDKDFMKTYKPKKTLTLTEIWENYETRKKVISEKEVNDTGSSWTRFEKITGAKTVSDISKQVIINYKDTILVVVQREKDKRLYD